MKWPNVPDKSGATRATRYDACGRRAIWYRYDDIAGTLELWSGRSGHDDYAKLAIGDVVDARIMGDIEDVISSNAAATRWSEHDGGPFYTIEEIDRALGELGYAQRPFDGADTWKRCRVNMIVGLPWGCAEAELWEF